MKSRKLFASMLVLAFTFSFLVTGCEKKEMDSHSGDAMMEEGEKMDGEKMEGEKMEADGEAMEEGS